MAAAQAGLAVTNTLADDPLPEGVRIVRADEGLPELPECRYLMLKAREPRQPATDMLAAQVHEVFGGPWHPDRLGVALSTNNPAVRIGSYLRVRAHRIEPHTTRKV